MSELFGVPGEWVVQGGAVGLLLIVALMVFRGRLVPRSIYDELARDRDHWREAALRSIGHTDALLPAAQITAEMTRQLAAPPADTARVSRNSEAGR